MERESEGEREDEVEREWRREGGRLKREMGRGRDRGDSRSSIVADEVPAILSPTTGSKATADHVSRVLNHLQQSVARIQMNKMAVSLHHKHECYTSWHKTDIGM